MVTLEGEGEGGGQVGRERRSEGAGREREGERGRRKEKNGLLQLPIRYTVADVQNSVQSNLSYPDSCYPGTSQLILSILC